jgi:hypothetical protein
MVFSPSLLRNLSGFRRYDVDNEPFFFLGNLMKRCPMKPDRFEVI